MTVHVHTDKPALVGAVASALDQLAERCVAERGLFTVALAGGSTPADLYRSLASQQRSWWSSAVFLFGDERAVPPDHDQSNYKMVASTLLAGENAPATVHRIEAEHPPAEAARRYEATLREVFADTLPRIDLVLLGLGSDAHTASLFPGSPALEEQQRWVTENPVRVSGSDDVVQRITLTYPVLGAARQIWFLVAGASKRVALQRVLHAAPSADAPASLVAPTDGELHWWVDEAAYAP